MRYQLTGGLAALALIVGGCEPVSDGAQSSEPPPLPADYDADMIEPDAGPAPESDLIPVSDCPDEGPRLPVSGVCLGRAVNYMSGDLLIEAPAGCDWRIQEIDLLLDKVILYRALTCGDKSTRLSLSIGAQSASLELESSALGHSLGWEIARMFGDGESDPMGYLSRAIPENETDVCEIREARLEGWPEDALVIAPTPAARAAMPSDEPIAACGPLGVDEDAASFWRIIDEYAIFFSLGQDTFDIDPASFVVIDRLVTP